MKGDDRQKRAALLNPIKNPKTDGDYLVQLRHKLAPSGLEATGGVIVDLFYVPGKLIIDVDNYDKYLTFFETRSQGYKTFEELAANILDDLNNELVPKWIMLNVISEHAHTVHCVSVEERQPKWNNDDLLRNLRRRLS